MENNPFKKKSLIETPDPQVASEDPGKIGVSNVCPFLTSPSLVYIESTVQQKMKGAPPHQPALATSLSPCIEKSCAFWKDEEKCCAILVIAENLSVLAKLAK